MNNLLPLNHSESIKRFIDSKAVSIFIIVYIFLLMAILFNSCKEPIGLESSLNTINLSDYKYLKLRIGNEFVYEVSESDSTGARIGDIKTEIWKVEKIDTIQNQICYEINVFENTKKANTFKIYTNLNLVSIYSKFATGLLFDESQINLLNYYDVENNWNVISKNTDNYSDSSIILIDTIKIFNSKNNSNDIYVTKIIKKIDVVFNNSIQREFNNKLENGISNQINTNLIEYIEKIDVSNNVSLYNTNLLFNSVQEIQLTENFGITAINAQITEQFKDKTNNNLPFYSSKYINKKLISIR